jgi:hypothetical protein
LVVRLYLNEWRDNRESPAKLPLTLVSELDTYDRQKEADQLFDSAYKLDPDSPIGIGTLRKLIGDLRAAYAFTMLTLGPDPDNPSARIYKGASVITTKDGSQLFSVDTGIMFPQ